jgi:hypothetical protein
VWPAIAAATGTTPGERRPMSFVHDLPRRDDEWAALVARHGLDVPSSIVELVGENCLVYADMVMSDSRTGPFFNSTIAARQAGFADCTDTEDMFVAQLHHLAALGTVPPP